MNTQEPKADPLSLASDGELAQILCAALPPPLLGNVPGYPPVTPEEALARRDAAAIALLRSLEPADQTEAALAITCVTTSAHATDCLSQVQLHRPESDQAMKLRMQFARFSRESLRARSALLTLQEQRYKREAAARRAAAQRAMAQDAANGIANPGDAGAAQSAQPPAAKQPVQPPPAGTKSAPSRRSRPALRVIQGGLGT
jgi:hypothetical protein